MKKHQTLRLGWFVALSAFVALVCTLGALAASAPKVVGDWQGALDTGSGSLRVVIHVAQDNDGKLTATMDSPDQGATGIPISSITYTEPALHFEIPKMGAGYDGTMNKDNSGIAGNWKQGGGSLSLNFKRVGK